MLKSAAAARDLLATPRDVVVLHGDIHHDNILDFGELLLGLQSILKASSGNAVSIMRIFFAIPMR